MRIKLLKQIAGGMGVHEPGAVIDLPSNVAQALIGAGVALPVAAPAAVETATLSPPETAVLPAGGAMPAAPAEPDPVPVPEPAAAKPRRATKRKAKG